MNKYILVIIIFIAGVSAFTGVLILNKDPSYNPQESKISGDCNEFLYNKDAKVRVVFFASKEITSKYANYLLDTEPFNKYKQNISIYYVDDYSPKCINYKDIAVYCHSSELEKQAEKCAAKYIIAFDSQAASIRSSAYLNVVSINLNHPLNVILHEFGHAFGKLEEEYTPAKLGSKDKNCVQTCDSFRGDTDGCFEGCSRGDFYRSIDKGVMRTLNSDEFGKYNEMLLEEMFE